MKIVLDAFESFIGVNVWTMLFAWCNLFIIYLFLKKILFKPVKNMIDSRQKEVDDMYSDAQKSKEQAENLRVEYEDKISHVKEESEEILRTAVRKAQLQEENILKEAQDKATRTLDRATEQVKLEKKRAINEVKDEVSAMAINIASAVIERDVSESEHREIIDNFIDSIGDKND